MRPILLLACLAASLPAIAQTSRERAVAIDRVEIPRTEDFDIEAIGPALQLPWSLAELPEGGFLVTERHRGLRRIGSDGSASALFEGLPGTVLTTEDSGFLDVALDSDFASNRLVYLAYVEGPAEANRTAIWKARLDGDRLAEGRTIFRSNATKRGPSHPGGRLLFQPDGTLLLSVGDGYDYRDLAQDPSSHLGKVLRLTRDGTAPPDNPFVGRPGHAPEIWTLGHRNIQGLTRDPATGLVWSHEHGPRGGDEVNVLEPGRNYGWPLALFGIDYDGTRISDRLHVEGSEDPRFFWSPSIAPSGLAIYHGAQFPAWEGKVLVGALAARGLVLLRRGRETGLLVEEARLLTALRWRIRDVRVGRDGLVYLLTDEEQGRLLRLSPRRAAALAPDHPLHPLAALAGDWRGESQLSPSGSDRPDPIAETSTMQCGLVLADRHLRCTVRFVRADGRVRVVEQSYSAGVAPGSIHGSVLSDRWNGHWPGEFVRQADGALVADVPFERDGRRYVERVTIAFGADRNSLTHTEASRPEEGGAWIETFRWTMTRSN